MAIELSDPTRPVEFEEPQTNVHGSETGTHYVLTAVLISGNSKLAIINNKIVKVGDSLGQGKVKSIESNRVVLEESNRKLVLHLFGGAIKEPSK